MTQDNAEKLKDLLESLLQEAGPLKTKLSGTDTPDFQEWRLKVANILRSVYGDTSVHLRNFDGISYTLSIYSDRTPSSEFQAAYVKGIERAEAFLKALIFELENFGIRR